MNTQKKTECKRSTKYHKFYFAYLLLFALFLWGCDDEIVAPVYDDSIAPVEETELFGVVSNIDDVNNKIHFKSVQYATETELSFSAGADIQDKYGNAITISQVQLGSVVEVTYDANRNKLLSMYVSNDESVTEMKAVTKAVVDNVNHTISFHGETYSMTKNVCAFSDNTSIAVNEICPVDQITVWLYNDMVCSMYVELGHGYLKLKDYATYIGGIVEIGYDVIVPVTEDMLLTVPEGDYTLRISKGEDAGTKSLTIVKNQQLELSLADIAIEPKPTGYILFKIEPAGASVYIDGKKVNTEGAVEITYGKHKIHILADGYETYSASFNVNYAYKIKEYHLEPTEGTTTEADDDDSPTDSEASATTEAEKEDSSTENESDATTEDKGTEEGGKETESITTESKETNNKVTITAPIGVTIYLDGEYIGIAPMSFTKVVGSHILTLSMSGHLSKSYTVTFVDDGNDVTLEYESLTSIASLIE